MHQAEFFCSVLLHLRALETEKLKKDPWECRENLPASYVEAVSLSEILQKEYENRIRKESKEEETATLEVKGVDKRFRDMKNGRETPENGAASRKVDSKRRRKNNCSSPRNPFRRRSQRLSNARTSTSAVTAVQFEDELGPGDIPGELGDAFACFAEMDNSDKVGIGGTLVSTIKKLPHPQLVLQVPEGKTCSMIDNTSELTSAGKSGIGSERKGCVASDMAIPVLPDMYVLFSSANCV